MAYETAVSIQVRDEIVAAINAINQNDGFATDNVVAEGRIVPASKISAQNRRAHVGVRCVNQTMNPTNGNVFESTFTYRCVVRMDNATDEEFANFLQDIEAAIAQRPIPENVDGTYYKALLTYLEGVSISDLDEQTSDRIHEAECTVASLCHYAPCYLSGNP